jgi:integrase
MPPVDLTARLARETKPGARDVFLFDKALPGFGLRIHRSGAKAWIVQTRIEGKTRRIVIARHGEMEFAQARRRARDILARIRAGENPADDIRKEKTAPTVRDLAEEYLRRCDPYWKPSGRETIRIYLRARILPTFAKMPVDRVRPEDVAAWFDAASRDKPGAANRAFEILRSMMFRAEEYGFREPGTNPCLGIRKNPRRAIARFLDTGELARLGRALDAREDEWPEAVAAIRLLALTGCRRGEVLNLRWRDIGENAITLRDSKSGPRSVPLGEAARGNVIDTPPGPCDPDAFLFPRLGGSRHAHRLVACWRAVCDDANLGKVRLHDLRHTAASHAVMSGENLPLVGKLLGHRRHETTAGYAHLADGHLVETAEQVGGLIADAMNLHIVPPPSRPRERRRYGRWI